MLVYSFFCCCTSTVLRHLSAPVWKMCPIPDFPLMGENIIIFSNRTFRVFILNKNIHYWNLSNYIFGKYLEVRKEFTRFVWSKPLQKYWTVVTFVRSSWFSWTKTIISLFISKIIMKEIRLCKGKHMLTDYFSCYRLTNKSNPPPPFHDKKNSP